MTQTITIRQEGTFDADEVRVAIADSLARQLRQAIGRRDYFLARCRQLEEQYGMTSDAFVAAFEAGTIGDEADFFEWFGKKQLLDSWERRVRILEGTSVGAN